MALELTREKLKEIADELNCGMRCYYHIQTGELESYPDPDRLFDIDHDVWQDVMDKVDGNLSDYLRFDPMESHESFCIMADFVDGEMPGGEIRNRFVHALQQRNAFQQFKSMLHYYPDLLEQWYAYKEMRYIEYVQDIVEAHNSESDSECGKKLT